MKTVFNDLIPADLEFSDFLKPVRMGLFSYYVSKHKVLRSLSILHTRHYKICGYMLFLNDFQVYIFEN